MAFSAHPSCSLSSSLTLLDSPLSLSPRFDSELPAASLSFSFSSQRRPASMFSSFFLPFFVSCFLTHFPLLFLTFQSAIFIFLLFYLCFTSIFFLFFLPSFLTAFLRLAASTSFHHPGFVLSFVAAFSCLLSLDLLHIPHYLFLVHSFSSLSSQCLLPILHLLRIILQTLLTFSSIRTSNRLSVHQQSSDTKFTDTH